MSTSIRLAVAGLMAFVVVGTATAAPLPVPAARQDATAARIEPIVYKKHHVAHRHFAHRHYYHRGYYGGQDAAAGAAVAGAALGLIGGAIAASGGYGYPYGYGYGPGYYGYGYGPGYYGGW